MVVGSSMQRPSIKVIDCEPDNLQRSPFSDISASGGWYLLNSEARQTNDDDVDEENEAEKYESGDDVDATSLPKSTFHNRLGSPRQSNAHPETALKDKDLPMLSILSEQLPADDPAIGRTTYSRHGGGVGARGGGMRRASQAIVTGLTDVKAAHDLQNALSQVNRVIVTPRHVVIDDVTTQCRHHGKSSSLTELKRDTKMTKRRWQVPVYLHTVFIKIGEIDTLKETFFADVYIQARWREPAFDDQMDMELKDINWSKYWNPQLYVENSSGPQTEKIWYTVMFNEDRQAYIFERRRVSGKFNAIFELYQFPFDTQNVTVTLVSERSNHEVSLEADSGELSTVNVQSFVDEQEWRLYANVETCRETVIRIYQGDNSICPSFSALCHASRRCGFYVWNIMFVMFFISGMVFATFSIDYVKRENRLQTTFVLLLTTITFKFAASSSLPRISYLTYLDKYILSSMILLCTVCIWHAVAPWIGLPTENHLSADTDALIAFAAFFFFKHLTFFVFIYIKAIRKRNTFRKKERQHKLRIKELHRQDSVVGDLLPDINGIVQAHRRSTVASIWETHI